MLSYTVTFPAAGVYDLYARSRVGANGANDDSFFYGNTFGTKSPTAGTDWVNCNNLHNLGYTSGALAVDGAGAPRRACGNGLICRTTALAARPARYYPAARN